jgi:hypothetical protein
VVEHKADARFPDEQQDALQQALDARGATA